MEQKDKKKIRPLDDNTLMAFGKFRGKKLSDVPPWYLLWLPEQEWFVNNEINDGLHQYIEDNREALAIKKKAQYANDELL